MANYELGGAYYADEIAKQNNSMGQSPLQTQTQSPLQEPFDFNALNTSIGNLQTGIDSILTKFDTFKPGNGSVVDIGEFQPGITGPDTGIIRPPGGHDLISIDPGITDPRGITPYKKNENLDLTDRSGIMGEYSNYLQGGNGYQGPRPGVSTMAEFMGEEMSIGYGNSFGKFLDTFGIGDRLQFNNSMISATPYSTSASNGQLGSPFRPEGDMGKYVAFNDPGQPGAGYANYQDYSNSLPASPQGITSLPQSGYQV